MHRAHLASALTLVSSLFLGCAGDDDQVEPSAGAAGDLGKADDVTQPSTTIQVYDPSTSTWRTAKTLDSCYRGHEVATTPGGKVVLLGGQISRCGFTGNLASSRVQVFDPVTNGLTELPPMRQARNFFPVVSLPDGRIMVIGGRIGWNAQTNHLDFTSSVEVFDPRSNTWTELASMSVPRAYHTATLLNDGRVLVVGGADNSATEVYDPRTNAWTTHASPFGIRYNHTATLLPSGDVLVAGGSDGNQHEYPEYYAISQANTAVFSARRNVWHAKAPLPAPRHFHTATLDPDGRVLVVGGVNRFSMENGMVFRDMVAYDPRANAWSTSGALPQARQGHQVAVLRNHDLLAVGGQPFDPSSTDRMDIATLTWSASAPLASPMFANVTLTSLPDGRVVGIGGP
jgi:N-acetylneuraminic acid mutarotase